MGTNTTKKLNATALGARAESRTAAVLEVRPDGDNTGQPGELHATAVGDVLGARVTKPDAGAAVLFSRRASANTGRARRYFLVAGKRVPFDGTVVELWLDARRRVPSRARAAARAPPQPSPQRSIRS